MKKLALTLCLMAIIACAAPVAQAGDDNTTTGTPYIHLQSLRDQAKMEKQLRQCLEKLAQADYDKARKQMADFRRKINLLAYGIKDDVRLQPTNPYIQALAPLYQMAEAWLNLRPDDYAKIDEKPDRWRAQLLMNQAMHMGQAVGWANGILDQKKIGTSVEELARKADVAALAVAQQDGTEAAYTRFLTNATTADLIDQGMREREGVAYDKARRSQKLEECERYLDNYADQNPEHQAEIYRLAGQYAFERLGFTVQSCKQYLKRYPNTAQAPTVRERLYKYAFNELQPTAASCQAYLLEYPESPYVAEVTKLLYRYAYQEMPDNAEGWATYLAKYPQSPFCQQVLDKQLKQIYDRTIATGTAEAYQEFLAKYPDSGYAIEIARRLKDLTSTPEEINAEVQAIEKQNKQIPEPEAPEEPEPTEGESE